MLALRTGFEEIFRRNEYAHKLSDDRIKEIIVEITGLPKTDQVVGAIFGTFSAFNEYAKIADAGEFSQPSIVNGASHTDTTHSVGDGESRSNRRNPKEFNLVNTINVVLPETTDVQVYNAIFKALKDHLVE